MGPGPPLGPLPPPSPREGFRHGAGMVRVLAHPAVPSVPVGKAPPPCAQGPERKAGGPPGLGSDPMYIWECRQDRAPEPT